MNARWLRFLGVLVLVGCGSSASPGSGADPDTAGSEPGAEPADGDGSERRGETTRDEGEPETQGAAGERSSDEGGAPAVNPDSISSTPSEATFTRCEPAPAPGCEGCGLTIALRRRRGWRAAAYRFEILSEGNHIRCNLSLPCESTDPVVCEASPGAPRVTVVTTGCGGPAASQGLEALRFAPEACPEEMRIESYRDDIRAGVQDIRPRYQDGTAAARHDMAR